MTRPPCADSTARLPRDRRTVHDASILFAPSRCDSVDTSDSRCDLSLIWLIWGKKHQIGQIGQIKLFPLIPHQNLISKLDLSQTTRAAMEPVPAPRVDRGYRRMAYAAAAEFLGTASVPQERTHADGTSTEEVWTFFYRFEDFGIALEQLRLDGADAPPAPHDTAALAVIHLFLPLDDSHHRGARCTIAGLRVHEAVGGKGVGTQLYSAMLAHAFYRSQTPKFELNVPSRTAFPQHCARLIGQAEASLSLQLGDGPCRRTGTMLLFLQRFGWTECAPPMPMRLDQPFITPFALQNPVEFQAPSELAPPPVSTRACDWDSRIRYGRNLASVSRPLFTGGPCISANEGLLKFVLPGYFCNEVATYVTNPSKLGSNAKGRFLDIGEWNGRPDAVYSMKQHVNVNAKVIKPSVQQKCNFISNCPDQAHRMLRSIPGLGNLAHGALTVLGLAGPDLDYAFRHIGCVHLFKLTPDNQLSYGWHSDDTDLVTIISSLGSRVSMKEKLSACAGIRSVVVQLSPDAQTAMVMLGFEPIMYNGQGSTVAFHGSALHASLPWKEGSSKKSVWKVSMFWLPMAFGLKADPLH